MSGDRLGGVRACRPACRERASRISRPALLAFVGVAVAVLAAGAQAAPGDLDPGFGSGGRILTTFSDRAQSYPYALVIQPDGKIVAAGEDIPDIRLSPDRDFALIRYNPDGSLDQGFGSGGIVLTDLASASVDRAFDLALQPDGKIVVAGASRSRPDVYTTVAQPALVRYNADGSLDAGFGSGGIVLTDLGSAGAATAIVIQPDGKIVAAGAGAAAGRLNGFALVRYNPDGSLDPTFGSDGIVLTDLSGSDSYAYAEAYALVLQPDGKLVAAGVTAGRDSREFALVRYDSDGSLDSGFGSGGEVVTHVGQEDAASALALQADGKLVAAGVTWAGSSHDFALVRYRADGSLDPAFGSDGIVLTDVASGTDDNAAALALQQDGKIVAAGTSSGRDRGYFALVRYSADGTLDPHFGSGGKAVTSLAPASSDSASALALQPDGKLVAAGGSRVGDSISFGLIRYLGGPPVDTKPPMTSATLTPPPNAAGWNTDEVTVELRATDDEHGSGVAGVSFAAQGAETMGATTVAGDAATLHVRHEGITTITFDAVDRAGNGAAERTVTVKLDRIGPVVSSTRSPAPNASGWNATSVSVTFTATDALSGVLAPAEQDVVLAGEGASQTATATFGDRAGNTTVASLGGISIDRTPPTVTCSASPAILWPPNHKLVPVATTVAVADVLSRPAGFVLLSARSTEPGTGHGNGDTTGDLQGWTFGDADTAGLLRAERAGSSPGRTYTLTYRGLDSAGNAATCATSVSVTNSTR